METILIFCAHPDDEIIGVGGTIAKYAQEGKRIISCIFSKGEMSHPWVQERHVRQVRTQESLVAGNIVGVQETIFLGLPDGKLSKIAEKAVPEIKDIVRRYDPDKIFTHSQDDFIYRDHTAVHQAVMKALDEIDWKKAVYTFNIWFMNLRRRNDPKLVVDISDTFKKKREALRAFTSQKLALLQLIPVVYAKAFMDGLSSDSRSAEIFYKVR